MKSEGLQLLLHTSWLVILNIIGIDTILFLLYRRIDHTKRKFDHAKKLELNCNKIVNFYNMMFWS